MMWWANTIHDKNFKQIHDTVDGKGNFGRSKNLYINDQKSFIIIHRDYIIYIGNCNHREREREREMGITKLQNLK